VHGVDGAKKMTKTIWVTSDLHFNHKNIVKGISKWDNKDKCRSFSSLEEHDERLTSGLNLLVQSTDTLYVLGDFSFGYTSAISRARSRINCKDIILILGNHDWRIKNNREALDLFTEVCKKRIFLPPIFGQDKKIIMIHKPQSYIENNPDEYVLHGHTHTEGPTINGNRFNVGVDHHNFYPWDIKEVLDKLKKP